MLALALLFSAPAAAEEADGGLPPDVPAQETVVTGLRLPRPVREAPAAVTVIPRREIERSPAGTPDALLRTLPSAATFRRSSSLVADPSSQGLNLRGLGPSGVSRSLVLLDGVPLNDPFGGWVYWRAISLLDTERVEVAPSGASALYGNFALGGVAQVISRPIAGPEADAELLGGTQHTLDAALRASDRWGPAGAAVWGEYLATGGYPVVAPGQRGPVDGPAGSNHGAVGARAEAQAGRLQLHASGRYFQEDQRGGTIFTDARVRTGALGAGARLDAQRAGAFDLELFGGSQRFEQDRARIAAGRVSEALAGHQDVPSDDQGASLTWTSPDLEGAGRHVLLVGADLLRVAGTSDEHLFPPGSATAATVARKAGGEQQSAGLFAQDAARLGPVELAAAARLDLWRNLAGQAQSTRADGSSRLTAFPERSEAQLSPRLGALYRALPWLGLRASGYRAFRAPTLNELYRPFQVGTVLTAANPDLRAETLWGAEAGPELALGPLAARATGFWNDLDSPITNVTLAAPLPDGSTRQRQNLGRARARGAELELGLRAGRRWSAVAGYTFVDATVTEAPGHPDLVGKQLAQDPRHRGALALTFDDPELFTAVAALRVLGPQFEDDLNTLPMAGYPLVDLSASRRIYQALELYAAVENLLDRQYLVGRAGVDTIGQPRTARVGLRLHASP